MLAAGGLLGLLLVGAAVGGLMAGGGETLENDEAPADPDGPEDADTGGGTGGQDADLLSDTAGAIAVQDSEGPATSSLAEVLFAPSVPGWDGDADLPSAEPDGAPGATPVAETAPAEDGSLPLGQPADVYDVVETAPFGAGPELPVVTGFQPETDRLILDFEGTDAEAPEITVDGETGPGLVIVAANGVPVVLVDGADLTADHVEVVMNPSDAGGFDAAGALHDMARDGGAEDDALDGRSAMQHLLGATEAQTAGPGGAALEGGAAGDGLFGADGDDTLSGLGGSDELHGDAGDDLLKGGDGADFLSGGEGDDSLSGGTAGDLVFGGDGDDRLEGGDGDDGLQGGPGADTLLGESGDDAIDGTFADAQGADRDMGDVIDAGSGDDTVRIGLADRVTGGEGADTFVAQDRVDDAVEAGLVTDFDPSEDRIEILYDPDESPEPHLAVVDLPDGSGAAILLDGQTVLRIAGAQGLDPSVIELRAAKAAVSS